MDKLKVVKVRWPEHDTIYTRLRKYRIYCGNGYELMFDSFREASAAAVALNQELNDIFNSINSNLGLTYWHWKQYVLKSFKVNKIISEHFVNIETVISRTQKQYSSSEFQIKYMFKALTTLNTIIELMEEHYPTPANSLKLIKRNIETDQTRLTDLGKEIECKKTFCDFGQL